MTHSRVEITVYPEGRSFACSAGIRLHEALTNAGFSVPIPCGGNGTCRKCSLWLQSAAFLSKYNLAQLAATSQAGLPFEPLLAELSFQETLACQYTVDKSLVVWLPMSQRTNIAKILATHHQPEWLTNGDFPPTHQLIFGDIQVETAPYAVTVDIGTTTVVAELLRLQSDEHATRIKIGETKDDADFSATPWRSCGLCSCRNPQADFGDDVISRIQYASESPQQSAKLREIIVDTINKLIADLSRIAAITSDQISLIAIAGNTTMQQLFVGLDVTPLGHFPFVPAIKHYPVTRAADAGIAIRSDGRVVIFPVIGGFVGGDITAGITATQLRSQTDLSLLIDIGTNGEIVLWRPGGPLLAAATAAGPAFEGARIRHGMVAAPGAIEGVTFGDDLHIETIANVTPCGICGSGLIDLVAGLIQIGAIATSGKLSKEGLSPSVSDAIRDRMITVDGRSAFEIVPQSQSATGSAIVLTQQDIRQVQLAAGAIRAGVTLLLRKAECRPDELAMVFLAGGFGNYIRRENAQIIGLLPPEVPLERIIFCGNTSLAGAKAVLLNADCYREMQAVADVAECLDLSSFPDFSTVFAESMLFP